MKILALRLSEDGFEAELINILKDTERKYFITGNHSIVNCRKVINKHEVGKLIFCEGYEINKNLRRCDMINVMYWCLVDDYITTFDIQVKAVEVRRFALDEIQRREIKLSLLKSKINNSELEVLL